MKKSIRFYKRRRARTFMIAPLSVLILVLLTIPPAAAVQQMTADSNESISYTYNIKSVSPGDFEASVGNITKKATLRTDATPIGNLNFSDKVVYFLDHTSDPVEGNWITLGSPNEGRRVQLPQKLKFTYNGPKYMEYSGVLGILNKDEEESYTIKYPSTAPSYTTHPVYLPDENVTLSFHGVTSLKEQNVEIYLLKLTSNCAHELLNALLAGDISSVSVLFEDCVGGNHKKYLTRLDNYGDLSDYDLGCFNAGQYCIVMVRQNNDNSITVFSSTAFVVTDYELCIYSPDCIVKGEDLDIRMILGEASDTTGCTYGAVLIKEQAYKANIEINSDGTKAGTSVIINDLNIIDDFDINSSNLESKLYKDKLQTNLQVLIGTDGAITIGDQNNLSLTAFDLPVGRYYLLAGTYHPDKGLVGLAQKEVKIEPKKSPSSGGKGGKGGKGGGGGSPEPAKNVDSKELCQQFISNGKRIKFEFIQGATSVSYLEFGAKKTAGKVTAIVEELKGKSLLTPAAPEGVIYKHLNIWVGSGGFATSNNIESAIVGFRVSKDWIDKNHINADTISLQHYSKDKWNPLNTEKVSEDNDYIYFEAETPGFSPFAITASKNILEIGEKAGENEGSDIPDGKQPDSSEVTGSDISSKEKGSSWLKIACFFIGFLVIILIGIGVLKRNKPGR